MKLGKYLQSNKGFFLLALIAAILGTIATFFIGGCTKAEEQEQSRVIASKRVKIDVRENAQDEVLVASIEKERAHDAAVAVKAARKKKESNKKVRKTVKAPERTKRPGAKKAPLKTITKSWAINVASFTRLPEAQRLKPRLKSSGRSAYITEFTKDNILYYRVRVGFFASRTEAKKEGRAISSRFKNTGDAWVVQPGMAELTLHSN
ncbi:MAG: SPOR domain-containing protein [Thermodesulfobacteriota bacterium]